MKKITTLSFFFLPTFTHTSCQEQVKNYPGETSEPSWDRFLLQPQEKPTPREAEPSAL